MSESLRYQNEHIQEHLASHYVLGTQSQSVRRRTETLMQRYPELEARVYAWQKHLSQLHQQTPEIPPPSRVWQTVEQQLFHPTSSSGSLGRWWQSLRMWQGLSAALLVAILVLSVPQEQTVRTAGYLAVMSNTQDTAIEPFVLTAYKGEKAGQSTLHLQWNRRQQAFDTKGLTLWAIHQQTGERLELGALDDTQGGKRLSKEEWQVIKNSSELLVLNGQQVVFRGPCLQLGQWANNS